jgi:V8-like Glu-specific endopeptidase
MKDFQNNGNMEILNSISKNEHEYYGITWYEKLTGRYKYLLGQKMNEEVDILDVKRIEKGEYVFIKFPPKYNTINAWMEFTNKKLNKIGYKAKEENGISFEYYPKGFSEEYELWVLVEKT